MARWTRDYATGATICAICGKPREGRSKCCPTSPYISREEFARKYFGPEAVFGAMPAPGTKEYENWVSPSTVRDFHEDYLASNSTLADYIKRTTSDNPGRPDEMSLPQSARKAWAGRGGLQAALRQYKRKQPGEFAKLSEVLKERPKPDATSARELYLFIQNDGDLYRQQFLPIIMNLAWKIGRGVYDKKLAVKFWMHLADEGARRYGKQFGSGYSLEGFDKPTRFMVAAMLARDFMDKFRNREYTPEVMALAKGKLLNPYGPRMVRSGKTGLRLLNPTAFRGGHLLSGGIDWATDVKHDGDPNEADIQWEKRRAIAAVMKLIGPDLAKWKAKTRFKFTGFRFEGVVWHYSAEQEEMPEDEQGEPSEPKWHYSLSFIGPAAMVLKVVKQFGGSYTPSKTNPCRGLTSQARACYASGMASRNPVRKVPAPLSLNDLCDCGHQREDHQGKHGWGSCRACECPSFRDSGSNPYTRVRFPAHSSRLFRSKKTGRWSPLPGRRRNPLAGFIQRKGRRIQAFASHKPSRAAAMAEAYSVEEAGRVIGYKTLARRSSLSDALEMANPSKGAVLIGRKVMSVVYLDEAKARRCGAKNPSIPWKHDFTSADAKVYGLPDGSVLIKSEKKKLWGYR